MSVLGIQISHADSLHQHETDFVSASAAVKVTVGGVAISKFPREKSKWRPIIAVALNTSPRNIPRSTNEISTPPRFVLLPKLLMVMVAPSVMPMAQQAPASRLKQ